MDRVKTQRTEAGMEKMDPHGEAFKQEAYELLAEMETSLLELEETPDDAELIGRVFRAMHTIKGSGAMFGFGEIAAFTHQVETLFDLVRHGKIPVTKGLVDLTLSARDQIRAMLDGSEGGEAADAGRAGEILASLRKLMPGTDEKDEKKEEPVGPRGFSSTRGAIGSGLSQVAPGENVTYRIRFRPAPHIQQNGTNPMGLLAELRALGEGKIVAQTEAIPPLEELNPELCYTYWDMILTPRRGRDAIQEIFIFVEDDCELSIEVIDDGKNLDQETNNKKLGEILIERGTLTPDDLGRVLKSQKRIGEMLVESGVAGPGDIESALAEQQYIQEIRKNRQKAETASSIRVPLDKLDRLVNLVGELVTVQAHLVQAADVEKNPELLSIAEEVERLTQALRDNTLSIRMLPIGTTFSKFKRLVRDLSHELGKEVEMTTEGAQTDLDKTVIERLNDPLVHLIRNSIDHGIEPPAMREAAGKPRQGTVHLAAAHSGSDVLIQIRDDGAGLNLEAIRARAIEKGWIPPGVELPEKELFALILLPGFSTAKKVTGISGRGVGMDVVKRAIDALRGSIEIGSQRGKGTTITLKLPLTLAIIDGLLVKIGEAYFVLPLSAVEECLELTREEVAKAHGRHLASVRGQIVPYIRLRERFKIEGEPPAIEQIVIAEKDGGRVGFVVDRVIGEHQTVIKTLGRVYRDMKGISGATLLGDGTVALILDIPDLVQNTAMEEQALR